VSSHCKKSDQSIETPLSHAADVEELAKEKFGEAYSIQENETKRFYLVLKRNRTPVETGINFFVYDKEKSLIIHEDVIPSGKVEWSEAYQIKVQKYSGTVRLNNQQGNVSGYLLDVKTGQVINY